MISEFTGKYYFLSNYFEVPVAYNGIVYRNSEAAFQAQKTTDVNAQLKFAHYSASIAKRYGRQLHLRSDWEQIKDGVMYEICKCKFEQNPLYRLRLLATGDEELVEGNSWGDTYWGVCKGKGENHLGKILMRICEELSETF